MVTNTFHVIVIPDEDLITLIHANYILMVMKEKVFHFLASVFPSHVVYLVN